MRRLGSPTVSDEKVVHAFPGSELPENPMQIERSKVMFCSHENIRLVEHDRTVHCVKCGATLDPFNFLFNNALVIRQAWTNHRLANEKVRELSDRIGALMKEEKRLRALVKRLQEKSGEV